MLLVYRLGLGYAGDAPGVIDRARSLAFLALSLVQFGAPLEGLPELARAGRLRIFGRPRWIRLGAFLTILMPLAAAFFVPPLRSALGLTVPEPGEAASVAAGVLGYAIIRIILKAASKRPGTLFQRT